MRKLMTASVLGMALALAGCGQRVEVPAATVGKIMTKDGYKQGTIGTSKFRLPFCIWYCDALVTLSVADNAVAEKMELYMPKDKLVMDFTLQTTLSVKDTGYDDLFERIPAQTIKGVDTRIIPLDAVYKTYAQQIIRAEAREFLTQYSINEIASSLEAVNAALTQKLTESINRCTPFQVRYVGISDLQYPELIVEAQKRAAERTENIRQEEAQLELSKVQLERNLQEQKMQRLVDVERAEAEAEVNRIVSASMTDRYVKYRELIVLEALAKSENKVFIPMPMLDSVASQIMIAK